jgi:protein-disulfide isomerase
MRSRRTQILLALVGGLVLAAVLVGVTVFGSQEEATPQAVVAGLDEVTELLAGVPQQGNVLGRDDAPVTLVEYADPQCPHCAHFALDGFPHLVWDYVREGKLRIEFRGMTFMGPDSDTALRAALAAGEQGRLYHVMDMLFYAQGEPRSGWVTDELVRGIAASVPGLDGERMLDDMDSDRVTKLVVEHAALAEAAGVPGTPYFELGPTGGTLTPLEVQSLSIDAFRPAIDALLEG